MSVALSGTGSWPRVDDGVASVGELWVEDVVEDDGSVDAGEATS